MHRPTSLLFLAAALALSVQATPTISAIPASGDVGNVPGGIAGWGFVLTNDSTADWVVLTGSEFTGSPVYGSYLDYLSLATAPLYVAGPAPESASIDQGWDGNAQLGLGEFDINSTALVGANIAGDLVVHYSVFSQDPNNPAFDPDTSTVIADATLSTPVSVTVSPEPGALALLGAGLLQLGWVLRTRAKRPRDCPPAKS